MRKTLALSATVLVMLLGSSAVRAQQTPTSPARSTPATRQAESDEYTRYELLAPEANTFKILYEVTANTPGATHYL
jgi:hypothetical protein